MANDLETRDCVYYTKKTLGDTRNISCTPVFSKVLEFFVLEKLKTEAMPDKNQFGGLAGLSTNHYLVQA